MKKKITKIKRRSSGLVDSAVGAAVELGHAAEKLQESWDHVKEAQHKGHRITNKAKQAGKKVIKTAKRMVGASR